MTHLTAARRAGARETLSFRAALAVFAVAVLDDAFVHPEPGTRFADHLVSGLVPVAAAAALAWVYPRLRPGARASAALACGVLALVAGIAPALVAGPARAAAPANDDREHAAPVTALPFSVTQSTVEATPDGINCVSSNAVWFRYTATSRIALRASTEGSSFSTGINVSVVSADGTTVQLMCEDDSPTGPGRVATFQTAPGSTYYFAVGGKETSGDLVFELKQVPIPHNDDFRGATSVAGLPFERSSAIPAASVQAGEPIPPREGFVAHSVWYRFEPGSDGFATVDSTAVSTMIAVYGGARLDRLTPVAYAGSGGPVTFRYLAGHRYRIQIADSFFTGVATTVRFDVATPLVVGFNMDLQANTQMDTGSAPRPSIRAAAWTP